MAKCKGCGKEIVWVEVNGKPVPLDTRPAVYQYYEHDGKLKGVRVPREQYAVSHFVTCPKADQFRRQKPENRDG